MGKALGAIGAVIAVLQIGDWASKQLGDTAAEGEKAAEAVAAFNNSAAGFETSMAAFGGAATTLGSDLNAAFNPTLWDRISHVTMWIASLGGHLPWMAESGDVIDAAQTHFAAFDGALAAMVQSGHAAEAAKAFDNMAQAAAAQGINVDQLRDILPGYTAALRDSGTAAKEVATAVDQTTAAWKAYFAIQADGSDESNRARARDEAAGLRRTDVEIARAREQAAADAMNERAQDALATWNETIAAYQTAKQKLQDLTRARAEEIKAIGSQLTAGGKLNAVFDMNAYAAATDKAKQARLGLADAEKAVREAKGDVKRAKTPEELNAAIAAEAPACAKRSSG
jgi:hypothetical protein